MFDKKEFKRLISIRKKTDGFDDFSVDIACKNTINCTCKDIEVFNDFIEYMKSEMTSDEYIYISEISYALSGIYPSLKFIEAYKGLAEKYPKETAEYHISTFIEDAEGMVKYFLEDEDERVKRLKEWFDDDLEFIQSYLNKK